MTVLLLNDEIVSNKQLIAAWYRISVLLLTDEDNEKIF